MGRRGRLGSPGEGRTLRGDRGPGQDRGAVSLLTFWNPPTTAQVIVESVPPNAAKGKDVLLGATVMSSHQIISYVVDTQVTTPGPAHSGRETIYPNGSLLFQRVTLNDTGNYTLQIVRTNAQVEQGTGQIRVFPDLPKPSITSNNSDPMENADSVVLMCDLQTQSTSYLWSVNRKSLPASIRLQLSLDNRTLTIYCCETQNPVSASCSDPFTLNVLCSVITGASGWDFLRQGWDPAQRDSVAVIQTRSFSFPWITSRVALLSFLQMAPVPPPFPLRLLLPSRGQPQALSHAASNLHSTLGLSMGGPSCPHRSSLSPTSLRMIVEPIPASPLTLALASIRPQSRLSQSLVSGSLERLH
uniref:Ig-like domain-containing protein n=1 Tax=Ailuropoda melanoleuca TaxID=9646 RepID=A0A7N5KF51_AILME